MWVSSFWVGDYVGFFILGGSLCRFLHSGWGTMWVSLFSVGCYVGFFTLCW